MDHHRYRLSFNQETYGVIPINFDAVDDPAELIFQQTAGDLGMDAI